MITVVSLETDIEVSQVTNNSLSLYSSCPAFSVGLFCARHIPLTV
jgi:hypothetical protein